MGTKGTLILEQEQEIMLYKDSDTSTRVGVRDDKGGAMLDTQASGQWAAVAQAAMSGPVSRGYREEMEHFAWCLRHPGPGQSASLLSGSGAGGCHRRADGERRVEEVAEG